MNTSSKKGHQVFMCTSKIEANEIRQDIIKDTEVLSEQVWIEHEEHPDPDHCGFQYVKVDEDVYSKHGEPIEVAIDNNLARTKLTIALENAKYNHPGFKTELQELIESVGEVPNSDIIHDAEALINYNLY